MYRLQFLIQFIFSYRSILTNFDFKVYTVGRQQICNKKDHCSGDVGHRLVHRQCKSVEIHPSSGRKTRFLHAPSDTDFSFNIFTGKYRYKHLYYHYNSDILKKRAPG